MFLFTPRGELIKIYQFLFGLAFGGVNSWLNGNTILLIILTPVDMELCLNSTAAGVYNLE